MEGNHWQFNGRGMISNDLKDNPSHAMYHYSLHLPDTI